MLGLVLAHDEGENQRNLFAVTHADHAAEPL